MKRRDALRELMKPALNQDGHDPLEAAGAAARSAAPPTPTLAEPIRSGALRSMRLSLRQMSAEADEARALRAQIEDGQHVVELDPALVDPSFVADRIPVERDPGHEAFVRSVGEAGQQVPILVRPHPDAPGRYQAAYGHRRLRAAAALGRKVRAIVRSMSDVELVVAQGKENGERRDLSFIERATFAAHLERRGFERSTIMAAMGVDKADLSRLIAIARSVPAALVQAIGPAPKAGRPRWTQLAEALAGGGDAMARLEATLTSPAFLAADSDRRFALALAVVRSAPDGASSTAGEAWRDAQGRALVHIERSPAGTRLIVDERRAAGFGAYLIERLPELHAAFVSAAGPSRPRVARRARGPSTGASRHLTANEGGLDET